MLKPLEKEMSKEMYFGLSKTHIWGGIVIVFTVSELVKVKK